MKNTLGGIGDGNTLGMAATGGCLSYVGGNITRWKFCPADAKELQGDWSYCPTCGGLIGVLSPVWPSITIGPNTIGPNTTFTANAK